jgi:uncharacterized protein (TIGR00369 family)
MRMTDGLNACRQWPRRDFDVWVTRYPPVIPIDPAFEARVRESFSRQRHMATLGAQIVFIGPGEVHLAFPFAAQFCQQNGFMHAGAIASVADSANGYAAYTLAPPDTDVLAVEFKINLLAPARGTEFLACARVLRPGRTLTVCQADVFTSGAAERILIATMLSTIIVRPRGGADVTAS